MTTPSVNYWFLFLSNNIAIVNSRNFWYINVVLSYFVLMYSNSNLTIYAFGWCKQNLDMQALSRWVKYKVDKKWATIHYNYEAITQWLTCPLPQIRQYAVYSRGCICQLGHYLCLTVLARLSWLKQNKWTVVAAIGTLWFFPLKNRLPLQFENIDENAQKSRIWRIQIKERAFMFCIYSKSCFNIWEQTIVSQLASHQHWLIYGNSEKRITLWCNHDIA